MRAIFHLGLQKTGTTTIQHFLRGNAAALSEQGIAARRVPNGVVARQDSQLEFGICQFARAGRLLPNPGTASSYRVEDLDALQRFADRYEARLRKFIAGRAEQVCLISSEHVGAWTVDEDLARAMDDWLHTLFDEVQYVMYIRRQEDWLLSLYSQALRNGHAPNLGRYVRRLIRQDYARRVDPWYTVAGPERFRLRLMEPDALTDGDLLADFAEVAGISLDGLWRPPRRNESYSPDAAYLLRMVNAARNAPDRQIDTDLRDSIERALSEVTAGREKLQLSPAQVEAIRVTNAAANEALRARFFPERGELFPPRAGVADAPARPFLKVSRDSMADLCLDLIVHLMRAEGGTDTARKLKSILAKRDMPRWPFSWTKTPR